MDAIEHVIGGAVCALAILMIIMWIVRTVVRERVRVAVSTGQGHLVMVTRRRVRRIDFVLFEMGLAFVLAVAGYVTLGVMPA